MKSLLKLLKELKHFFTLKGTMKPKEWKELDLFPRWNIYEPELNNRDLTKKFRFFNYIIKYRLVAPVLLIAERLLKKFNVKDVPDAPYNRNLKIFDKAYKATLDIWVEQYLGSRAKPEEIKRRMEGFSVRMLNTCRDMIVSGVLYDTAYREFLNILMFEIGKEMFAEYKDKEVHHLFYTGNNCYNVYYQAIFELFQGKGTSPSEIKTRNLSIGTGVIGEAKKEDEVKKNNKQDNSSDAVPDSKKV